MKLEIIKEFSSVFLKLKYWLVINGTPVDSFQTEDEAMLRLEEVKRAYLSCKNTGPETIYSVEV